MTWTFFKLLQIKNVYTSQKACFLCQPKNHLEIMKLSLEFGTFPFTLNKV